MEMTATTNLNTGILTGLHLTVDGLCACCVFMLSPQLGAHQAFLLFVAYNVLAFLTQPFVGLYADRRPRTLPIFKMSLALLMGGAAATAWFCTAPFRPPFLPYLATFLFGMGNSLFHVYGGKSVATRTGNDMRHLGIFVSSGAIGLVVGERYATLTGLLVTAGLMAVLSYSLTRSCTTERSYTYSLSRPILTHNTFTHRNLSYGSATSLFLFVLLIVFIRSFMGRMLPASTGSNASYVLLVGLLAFMGKFLGGFVGRAMGVWTTLTLAMLTAGLCFLLCGWHTLFPLALTLAINLTMPLTLFLANQQMPHREGFAFGMLAATLIPGTALGTYCSTLPFSLPLLYALVATIVIEACVLLAIRERRWQVVGISVVMNIMTNLPLNLFLLANPALHTSLPVQIGLECGVVVVESMLYFLVLHDGRKAFSYALLCNAISYLSGLLFTYLY